MHLKIKHLAQYIIYSTVVLCLFQTTAQSQIVNNGTFRGNFGINVPPGWQSCFSTSTVDVQPGSFAVSHRPIDGNSYLGMACRSQDTTNPGTCEEVNQELNEELIAGRCYQVEVHLARSLDVSVVSFRNAIDLDISVGDEACNTKLEIVHFGPISHTGWEKYIGIFSPTENMSHLSLKAVYSRLPQYSGYLLMDNVIIREMESPQPQSFEICEGSFVNLTSFINNAESYVWSTGETTPNINVTETGDYFVDVTNAGCTLRREYNVLVKPNPKFELEERISVCEGETIRLDVFQEGATYRWQDGSTDSFFIVDAAGNYTVTITLGETCSITRTVRVLEKAGPIVDLPAEISLCGDEQLRLEVGQDNATYLWQDGSTDAFFDLQGSGTYTVQVNVNGCIVERSVNVVRKPNPVIDLESINTFCPGDMLVLDVSQPRATYLWQDGSSNSSFVAEEVGSYNVTVTIDGCSIEQNIEVTRGECVSVLKMPNAFSPNGDFKNDVFTPIESINIPQMETLIFNRWGDQIFSTTNLNIEWDGNLPNGSEAPPSTYYWSIKYSNIDGFIKSQKGTVTLLR